MHCLGELWRSLRYLFHRDRMDQDLEDEMRHHLEMKAAVSGTPLLAARQFGNLAALKQQSRDAWLWEPLVRLAGDLQQALRQWRKNPTFAAIALATLAVGIGANTVIFTVVHSVLLAPLQYRDPARLVTIIGVRPHWTDRVSASDIAGLQAHSSTLADIGLSTWHQANLIGAGEPQQLVGACVSPNLFPLLGITPVIGRTTELSSDSILLSHALWQRLFGGNPHALGKSIVLGKRSRTVAGVMPPWFHFPDVETEYWIPLEPDPAAGNDSSPTYVAIARLRPNATVQQAHAEAQAYGQHLKSTRRASQAWNLDAVPVAAHLVKDVRAALLTLFAAVTLVLLVACANVANLQMSRGIQRRQEMALRAAIGASRGRLARLLLSESLLLALAGGALGLLLAQASLGALIALYPPGLPRASEIALDGTVLAFTALLSLAAAFLTGLAPALRLSRADLHSILKPGPRSVGRGGARTRSALVTAQVALALVLLICAGLLIRSLVERTRVDGFDPSGVLLVEINSVSSARLAPILDRVRALPGVAAAGATSSPAYTQMMSINVYAPGGRDSHDTIDPIFEVVSPGYFEAMGIALRQGRFIGRSDTDAAPHVAVIDQFMARRAFPGQDPLGRAISFVGSLKPVTVVGVVSDVNRIGDYFAAKPKLYVPASQLDIETDIVTIRTAGTPLKTAPSVRAIIRQLEPAAPIVRMTTARDDMSGIVASPRFYTMILGAFAAIALALAALGVYGVVSFSVSTRTHEIGVRTALGATTSAVVGRLMREGAAVILLGAVVGEAAALAATRLLSTTGLLYQVKPTDPLTFAAVPAALLATAFAACYLPARRAAAIDPATALRNE